MKTDYSKTCWSCRKLSMKAKDNYYRCTACGATWNPLPEQGSPALCQGSEPIRNSAGKIVGHKSKPSLANIKRLHRESTHKSGQGS